MGVQLGLEDNRPSKEEAEVVAIMGSATGLETDDTKTTLQSVFAPLHGSNDFGSELSLMQVFEEDEEEGPVVVATPNQAMEAGTKEEGTKEEGSSEEEEEGTSEEEEASAKETRDPQSEYPRCYDEAARC